MPDSLQRQWAILLLLPHAPRKLDAGALDALLRARGIAVTRRTLQRDLVVMAETLPIRCDERSKPYGWSWTRDAPSLLGRTSPHVAVTLKLALQLLSDHLPADTLAYLRAHEHLFDAMLVGTGQATR